MSENPNYILKRIANYKEAIESEYAKASDEQTKKYLDLDLEILNDFLKSLANYTASVFNDKFNTKNRELIKSNCNSISEYQDIIKQADNSRRAAHNSLITSMAILDRTCQFYNVEPIYGQFGDYLEDSSKLINSKDSKAQEKRRQITSWATDFTIACTAGASLGIEPNDIEHNCSPNLFESISSKLRTIGEKGMVNEINNMVDSSKKDKNENIR